MKIWSLTLEKKEAILKQRDDKKQELKNLQVSKYYFYAPNACNLNLNKFILSVYW